jgi:4-hydroxy-3-polyprenylbenzoate decarboxylase
MKPLVVAITGASGAPYAVRLVDVLTEAGRDVHLTISSAGNTVLQHELGIRIHLNDFDVAAFGKIGGGTCRFLDNTNSIDFGSRAGRIHYYHFSDFMAPIASGSFLTDGMAICPCSGSTLSAVVTGASNNLIQRAADVHLKERRPLVLIPREAPLSIVQLENMKRASEIGAVMLPAMPGWYHNVQTPHDLVDFVVARVLDQLNVAHALVKRWGEA